MLQFWLHSKTLAQWQVGADPQTDQFSKLMLSFLVETKRVKAQKQAIKSVCLMLRNRSLTKQPVLVKNLQQLERETLSMVSE